MSEADQGARKRGCILKLLIVWVSIWVVVIGVILVIRLRAVTDPQDVLLRADQLVKLDLPDRFEPYRINRAFGLEVISFWDTEHMADERAQAIIAIQRDDDWKEWTLDKLRQSTMIDLEKRLNELEFKTREQRLEQNASGIEVIRFSGVQKMDDGLKEATCCYRFVMSKEGPLRIQSLGLDSAFPPEEQIALLSAARPAD
ncbi:MAG: hypothetical protein KDC35_05530 [Acidobacteria bacterium]|nr:hypothetical protein [Acidobacteriota bacterium]